jgi:hypothetical protein
MPNSTQPLAPCYPVFYVLGELASLLVVADAHPLCPWFANKCPTLC